MFFFFSKRNNYYSIKWLQTHKLSISHAWPLIDILGANYLSISKFHNVKFSVFNPYFYLSFSKYFLRNLKLKKLITGFFNVTQKTCYALFSDNFLNQFYFLTRPLIFLSLTKLSFVLYAYFTL